MLSERVQYQGEAGIFELSFQNCISQNTGKCKLGTFSLRQSHSYQYIIKNQGTIMNELL